MNGSITASIFLLFAYIGSLYLSELLPLQQLSMELAQSLNGVKKAKQILDLPIFDSVGDFPKSHDVTLKAVRFSYDGKTDVLTDCDLHVAEGEKVAIVGASGAGKTTVIELISRFYDVTDGEVLIGGQNIKDIAYEKLLNNISIVFQKTFLTRDSVLENIRMGSNATLEEVRAAAKEAQIDDFYHVFAGWIRYESGQLRFSLFWRRKAEDCHCPRNFKKCTYSNSGRGNKCCRSRKSGRD